ncbi:FAS1 domain-containing protein [Schizophyllum amplum]|uniref:FAS1 domain-containing protein n=1 Tax=Schizophyllum amplum TaxID=97359 RepID=A0A550C5V5_9AGAR|nr:FAS1 domain-containing protein [Auriculariopsis ampla]
MRLLLLPLTFVALVAPLIDAYQTPLSLDTTSLTLVDALSADPDYTSLLRLLQRARLIPTLNRLNGSTLFAPTNDAIAKHRLWDAYLDAEHDLADNIQEQLRQQLFYHLLNYSLPAFEEDKIIVLKTLYYPHSPTEHPTPQPPPSPPWMPVPNGTLGHEPQRLRLAAHGQDAFVGANAFGKGGAGVVKGRVDAGNGILLGIDDVLEPPSRLADVISSMSSISYWNKIMTPEISTLLNSTDELTVFLPRDDAWDSLDKLERLYLESEYATDDLLRILNMHAVVQDGVKWSDVFEPAINLTTLDGSTLEVVTAPEKTMVGSAQLVHPDIYAANGVAHIVDGLLIPPNALQITPEKYLLALNCTKFISLLHSVNLTSLVNDTAAEYTILAPQDDVITIFGDDDNLPEPGSEDLKNMLRYHFLPGRWTPKKLKNGMLLETALEETGLDGGRQVLSVEVDDDALAGKEKDRSIRFGGAKVLGDHIWTNNTLVYFISRPVTPPTDALATALPSLDLSSFLAAVFSTSLADVLKATPRTSILVPHNSAFKRLGALVSAHLLANNAASKADLEQIVLHHTLDSVQYTNSLQTGAQHTFSTLQGSDVDLLRGENGSLSVRPSGGWPDMQAALYPKDTLTRTGVVHELSDLLFPRTVHLTLGKLMKAAQGSTMNTLISKAGMEWVLTGTAPPEGSPWADKGATWTLLCPTDDAFKSVNLTERYANVEDLQQTVAQHLILMPSASFDVDNRPLKLDDDPTYSTLRTSESEYGDITFRQQGDGESTGYVVGIKGARECGKPDSARVMAWGRATGSTGGGVIQIDRLLEPCEPSWFWKFGAPIAVGVFGVIAISCFFLGVRWVWQRDVTEATYEPVGGFGRSDDEEDV